MSSIFSRLNFPSSMSNETITYSDKTMNTMNNMPKLINEWQTADIANSNTGGYFKNPVQPHTSNLTIIVTNIESRSGGLPNLSSVYISANSVKPVITSFKLHADRLSGVTEPNASTASLPHYESAIGVGKVLSHLIYQSDGVANNAALVGSFSALYSSNTLQYYINTLSPYPDYIANSVFTADGNLYSNLSTTMINTMTSELDNLSNFLSTTVTSDVNFYTNSRAVMNDYENVKIFSKMGQTEQELTKELVGSDKLISRIT